ncbi:hypothetical protein EEL30_21535 [Brevibacillus laterosporus]|uniref:Uncharacterized protein n=1 Tax=Brevibacillus laterosporus TaxID=1465 RepID=A0A518VCB8_BRELA|nr:hypothetical protein EEL30_21535 [Brevibacillus laterosporus]
MQNKKFEELGKEIGAFTGLKQEAYGNSVDKSFELMKIFLKEYKNNDDTYTIPEVLLKHLLLQVRMIDKQNRIFSNPKGDLMGESPYKDLTGYSLIGVEMDNF